MNSTQARTITAIAALLACFAAATVAQALHRQPVQAAETAEAVTSSVAAFPWAGSGDTSVPSAATVFASMPAVAVDMQAPTF